MVGCKGRGGEGEGGREGAWLAARGGEGRERGEGVRGWLLVAWKA